MSFDILNKFSGVGKVKAVPVTAQRDMQLGALTVDIAERDVGNGLIALNIIIFKAPEVGRNECEPAIIKTCRQVFGNNKKHLDLIYRDEEEIRAKEGMVRRANAFDSWIVEIMPPRSNRFSVPILQETFIKILNRNL
jgi:hypothetical protein